MKTKETKTFQIDEESDTVRVDLFLKSQFSDLSRSSIQQMIQTGDVLLNSKKTKPSEKLKVHDHVEVLLHSSLEDSKDSPLFHKDLDLEIVFEDSAVVVVNKPPGLVTYPGAGQETDSLVHGLFDKLPKDSVEDRRPGVVHRLDKDTQGLIVFAKTKESQKKLAQQFKEKKARRVYQALCFGRFDILNGTIKSHLGRDPKNRKKQKSLKEGRLAVTHYEVLRSDEISHVQLSLETGRTHQIRVHMSENHHPLLSDPIYGHPKRVKELRNNTLQSRVKKLTQLALVATELEFCHPLTGQKMHFRVPWPEDFHIYEEDQ